MLDRWVIKFILGITHNQAFLGKDSFVFNWVKGDAWDKKNVSNANEKWSLVENQESAPLFVRAASKCVLFFTNKLSEF